MTGSLVKESRGEGIRHIRRIFSIEKMLLICYNIYYYSIIVGMSNWIFFFSESEWRFV